MLKLSFTFGLEPEDSPGGVCTLKPCVFSSLFGVPMPQKLYGWRQHARWLWREVNRWLNPGEFHGFQLDAAERTSALVEVTLW